ncbi:mismatch repair endonuclease PMS2-like [Trichogramma pretiosum]|uniref:mismatch repair endonuclease PMS2-like n=1 Tax=Trichogramma pretiosum TaxID=7493 RepID=UPI0006C9617C|nr:mismatch repair endonuclease PMS2-like [Trichogramma pretiosum]XP_023318889.1 mismatch repair endonuclease PMS2-like [Trichogramma pretiosum]
MDTSESVSNNVKQLNKNVVHKICSGQVILDLATAVKELVENSLDGKSTIIDVKLTDYGKSCITVIDNGKGILEDDFSSIGLKYHTSKLQEFSHLSTIETFGFRGEALSSLCSISDLSIITKHTSAENAFNLKFDKKGVLVSQTKCARQTGTTVHVKNIFKDLPVRFKEFNDNIKKEFAKMIRVLQGYCMVSTGVKITCTNTISNKCKTIVGTSATNNVLENISAIFGRKAKEDLIEVELQLPEADILHEYGLPENVVVNFSWECFVSSCNHSSGRAASDRQFLFVNNRPFDSIKIIKLINQIYHEYNQKQYPFVFLNVMLESSCVDINVTPDKRTVLFSQENIILATIKSSFTKIWDNVQRTFTKKSLLDIHPNIIKKESEQKISLESFKNKFKVKEKSYVDSQDDYMDHKICSQNLNNSNIEEEEKSCEDSQKNRIDDQLHSQNENDANIHEEESDYNFENRLEKVMPISLNKIKSKMGTLVDQKLSEKLTFKTELSSSDQETKLNEMLDKESFLKMQIIGQFNLGFILARLNEDIYIIDQHATDEKFRFEKLINNNKVETQRLITPNAVFLPISDECVLIDNKEMFEMNGFYFNINEDENPGSRVSLVGIPCVNKRKLGFEDMEELIFLIRENGGDSIDKIIRPSKVRALFASKACRTAVMIGKTLNQEEMRKLINQMSETKNPWSCPHGRPTTRLLFSLDSKTI